MGICGKADEIERQLRDRILQLSCEEQMGKLVRQSAERFEKQEEERKAEATQKGKERQRVDWADVDADEPINDMIYVKSTSPTTENWLRKLCTYSMNNNMSDEDKHDTNYINKYKCTNTYTRKLHNL